MPGRLPVGPGSVPFTLPPGGSHLPVKTTPGTVRDRYPVWPYPWPPPTPGSVNKAANGLRQAKVNAVKPGTSIPVIYGTERVTGQLIYVSGLGDVNAGSVYHVICEGEIEAIKKIYSADGSKIYDIDAGGVAAGLAGQGLLTVVGYAGTATQSVDSGINSAFSPGSRFPRTAYCVLNWFRSIYISSWQDAVPGGSLDASFEIKGLKIYDPRGGGSTAWSANPALVIRDLLTDPVHGAGIPTSKIDDTSFADAADACDSAGFTCNIAFASESDIGSWIEQVRLTCNGTLYVHDGKYKLWIDVAQSTVAVHFDTQINCRAVEYAPLNAQDHPTRVIIEFANAAKNYQNDSVTVDNPAVASGLPLAEARFKADGVSDEVQAHQICSYKLNSATRDLRGTLITGWEGVLLEPGTLCDLTTDEGLLTQQLLVLGVERQEEGVYKVDWRVYFDDVYDFDAITGDTPPDTWLSRAVTPPPAAVRRIVSGGGGWSWDKPRTYAASPTMYGAGFWTVANSTSVTASRINDGNKTNVAYITNANDYGMATLDLGAANDKAFGRCDFWLNRPLPDPQTVAPNLLLILRWSDDGVTWHDTYIDSNYTMTSWQDDPVGGVYPTHLEVPTNVGAHRYWRLMVYGVSQTVSVYEVQFLEYTEINDVVTYELRAWSQGTKPSNNAAVIASTATLPSDASPYTDGNIAPLDVFVGDSIGGGSETWRTAMTTRNAYSRVSNSAVPGYVQLTVAPSASVVSSVDGISGAVTLVAGTGITITDNSPSPGDITIAASGGGASPLTTKGDIWGYDTVDDRVPVGADGKVLTADSAAALGVSWQTPSTYTPPVTTKGDLFGFSSVPARLPVGSNGKLLVADSAQTLGLDWKTLTAVLPLTTKGDILAYDSAPNRLPVGSNNKILTADSTQTLGLAWASWTGKTIIEPLAGIIDGYNPYFTLTYTPNQPYIALFMDGQRVVGGIDYWRTGKNVTMRPAANKPRRSIFAVYTTDDTYTPSGSTPEAPVAGTGQTWTDVTIDNRLWRDVAWSPELRLFAAAMSTGGGGAGDHAIMTSPDGIVWTTVTTIPQSPQDGGWWGITWGNGQFVVTNDAGGAFSIQVLTSSDGITWAQTASGVNPDNTGNGWRGVVWAQERGIYVMVQNQNVAERAAAYSYDGLTWALGYTPTRFYNSVCWAPELGLFCAVGASPATNLHVMTSPDGVNWTAGTPPSATGNLLDVIWVRELALFVAAGTFTGGSVATSPDGATWTVQSYTIAGAIGGSAIVWDANRQLLVLGGGTPHTNSIATSPDGINWTTQTTSGVVSNAAMAVGYSPQDIIVSVGVGGSGMYSLS